jgi:hypothetical protein
VKRGKSRWRRYLGISNHAMFEAASDCYLHVDCDLRAVSSVYGATKPKTIMVAALTFPGYDAIAKGML